MDDFVNKVVNTRYKQTFHPNVPKGWANDPNGLIFYRGEGHLFYQHYPHRAKWGTMHWGHFKTKDFVKWENMPIALYPDQPYEAECGCCSGSAVEKDGNMVLMYTAAQSNLQRQCLATSYDGGVTFVKRKDNPILTAEMLSREVSPRDFRDPHIFVKGDTYYCLAGTRIIDPSEPVSIVMSPSQTVEIEGVQKLKTPVSNGNISNPDTMGEGNFGYGNMILFKSKDLLHWEYLGKLIYEQEELPHEYFCLDGVYECPAYFHSGGKDVVISSPQNLPQIGWEYQNLHSTLYMAGQLSLETGRFDIEDIQEIDAGFDIYAPQTMTLPDGRVIMIAWKEMWDRTFPTEEHNWAGTYTLPRELSYHDGRMYQLPVREIYNYRQNKVEITDVDIFHEHVTFEGIVGNKIELEVEFDLCEDSLLTGIRLCIQGDRSSYIYYDRTTKTLVYDRSMSGYEIVGREFNTMIRRCVLEDDKHLKLQIFIDISSIEIFINDGRYTMTGNFYGDPDNDLGVEVFASGHVHIKRMVKYDIVVK